MMIDVAIRDELVGIRELLEQMLRVLEAARSSVDARPTGDGVPGRYGIVRPSGTQPHALSDAC
jgi:hypothetical protein